MIRLALFTVGLSAVLFLGPAAAQVTLDTVQLTARSATQLGTSEGDPNAEDFCQKFGTPTGVTSAGTLSCASSSTIFGGSSASAETTYALRLDATSTLPNTPLAGFELDYNIFADAAPNLFTVSDLTPDGGTQAPKGSTVKVNFSS